MPIRFSTTTASLVARPPAMAAKPAEAANTPRSSTSLARHFSRSAMAWRNMPSAIGLRQVLPVQTNSTIVLPSRFKVCRDDPWRKTSKRSSYTRTTLDGCP